MSAKAATGVGTAIDVADYRHIVLQFSTASSANLTIKFAGSASATAPDFSAAQSLSNHWDYVSAYDYEDANIIEGDTGITLTGTDDNRTLLVNTDGLHYINANITARSAGSVTLVAVGYTNS